MKNSEYIYLEDNYTIFQAAQKLQIGMSTMDIFYFLQENRIINTKGIPYPEYNSNGYMFHINALYPKGGISPRKIHVPYFTPKGLKWLQERLLEYKQTKKIN